MSNLQLGRLFTSWEGFFYGQYNQKYWAVLLFPAGACYVRYRTETKFQYNVFITDDRVKPTYKNSLFGGWTNGKKMYVDDGVTVGAFKKMVYKGSDGIPEGVAVGCRGRMMEEGDNLALATRAFCKRDGRIVLWKEE